MKMPSVHRTSNIKALKSAISRPFNAQLGPEWTLLHERWHFVRHVEGVGPPEKRNLQHAERGGAWRSNFWPLDRDDRG